MKRNSESHKYPLFCHMFCQSFHDFVCFRFLLLRTDEFPSVCFCLSFHLLPPVCPFCKYPSSILIVPVVLLTAHCASVFLSPTLLTLQSFLIVKVLLPHFHPACPSLHSQCGPRAAPSPPRTLTSRAVDSSPQVRGPGAPSSTATPWI